MSKTGMTNRQALNIYLRAQVIDRVKAAEDLSDTVLMMWLFDHKDATAGITIYRELNWFWFTYGGRNFGKGLENIVQWLESDFGKDIEEESETWSQHSDSWGKAITEKYNVIRER